MNADRHDSLDPADWAALRLQGHRMLDDMLDYLEQVRDRPVWQPIPPEVRASIREPLPFEPGDLADAHDTFMRQILPYAAGNTHPRFMGWVHGGGTPVGMLAEMLAGALDANLGGRDHMPVAVERQILEWVRTMLGFPEGASGLFVTGTSMATFIAVLVARRATLGPAVRQDGVAASGQRLVGYAAAGAHGSVAQAFDLAGLGLTALRRLPVNDRHQLRLEALSEAIAADRQAGLTPFIVVGTAGSVDVGAIDPLSDLADLAREEGLWFHVDGAFGALAMLAPDLAPRLAGIERADSVAFDFHKWGQVPYDAGFVLVRDGQLHKDTFASPAAYLRRETRGLAAGSYWPCDYGPDLSRGFRALKTWFTLKVYGTRRLGEVVSGTCRIARHLGQLVAQSPELELLAPVALNIVCFRYRGDEAAFAKAAPDGTNHDETKHDETELNDLNSAIVADLHEAGIAVPSTTVLAGRLAIRAAIVNHRTTEQDVEMLVEAVIARGRARKRIQGVPVAP